MCLPKILIQGKLDVCGTLEIDSDLGCPLQPDLIAKPGPSRVPSSTNRVGSKSLHPRILLWSGPEA